MVMGGDRNDIVVLSLPCMDPGPASVDIVSNECAVAVAKADTLPGTINTADPQCGGNDIDGDALAGTVLKPGAAHASCPVLEELCLEPSGPCSSPVPGTSSVALPTPLRLDADGEYMQYEVAPDIGINIAADWQSRRGDSSAFRVTGPKDVTAFIKRRAGKLAYLVGRDGDALRGYLSPPVEVTIADPSARTRAGIPPTAAYFCFCYPLDSLAGLHQQLMKEEGMDQHWLCFTLYGGFAYFDASRQLLQVNAIVLSTSPASLRAVGPLQPPRSTLAMLRTSGRLRQVTLQPLLDAGFVRFAWVNPSELLPGDEHLLAGGTAHPLDAGGFVYVYDETESGEKSLLYAVQGAAPAKVRQKQPFPLETNIGEHGSLSSPRGSRHGSLSSPPGSRHGSLSSPPGSKHSSLSSPPGSGLLARRMDPSKNLAGAHKQLMQAIGKVIRAVTVSRLLTESPDVALSTARRPSDVTKAFRVQEARCLLDSDRDRLLAAVDAAYGDTAPFDEVRAPCPMLSRCHSLD